MDKIIKYIYWKCNNEHGLKDCLAFGKNIVIVLRLKKFAGDRKMKKYTDFEFWIGLLFWSRSLVWKVWLKINL